MKIVEIKGLCKEYPTFKLNNVSFDLKQGVITGFIGRNGSGKTTTIKSMLNIVHPSSGEISYFGLSFSQNEKEIKQRIGYSTGSVNFYPKKKIKDIVKVTSSFYDNWDEDTYREYLKVFQIDDNKTPSQLSEGMKVKLNLLLALSHQAELFILDEPTSGLDPFSRDELLETFIYLKKQGVAVLFSTHITSDIEKCADEVLYIRNGEIVSFCEIPDFKNDFSVDGETIEQTVLRMEKEARYVETSE